jgi:large subunit ribosomal protein L15
MMIHEITAMVVPYRATKRLGRGRGSGQGQTAGRGIKGAASRSGWRERASYEGGQMPLVMRLPKRGFSNDRFARPHHVVNIRQLEACCADRQEVTPRMLVESGLIRDTNLPLKVLGDGELTKALYVTAARFSAAARAKIEAAGGTVTEVRRAVWRRPRKVRRPGARGAAPSPSGEAREASTRPAGPGETRPQKLSKKTAAAPGEKPKRRTPTRPRGDRD